MPNENVLERRWQLGFESRAEDDGGRKVEGYAAVYGQRTEIGNWFTEEIREGAFSASVDRGDDVVFLIEHWDLPLARSTSGTLKLESDHHGLRMDTKMDGDDPDVQRIVPKMERGDLDKMSVGFYVRKDEWDYSDPDMPHRTVIEADLFDVSIVTHAAYEQTEIALRSALEVHKGVIAREGRKGWRDPRQTRLDIARMDEVIQRLKV